MARFQTVFAARERRGAFRYDVRVKASLALDHKTPSIECVIRDISQTGARIEVDSAAILAEEFTLVFSRECRVVRRSADGKKLGVEFLLPWSVTP
jgi:PilZ domain-containing protein